MKTRVLLTGATGTVGYNTLLNLINQKNLDITVFDLKTPHARKKLKPFKDRVNIIWGDISNKDHLIPATVDQDIVLHLAAIIPPAADNYPPLAYKVNVLGTKNLVDLLEILSPNAHIIHASSVAVYGDRIKNPWIKTTDPVQESPGDIYARTKIIAEKLITSSRLTWTIFRLNAVFGIGNHKISKLLFHMPLSTPIEIITPQDAGRAFAYAINHLDKLGGRIFNLAGGEKCRIIYKDFLERSFELFGLGKLNFPPDAFARQNFHCGYYVDSHELIDILNFNQDTIETYFEKVAKGISPMQRLFTRMFHRIIKASLLKKSEPLRALKKKDSRLIRHFFGNHNNLNSINTSG